MTTGSVESEDYGGDYLTLQQAAEMLKLSKVTVYKLVHKRKLIAYGPSRRNFYRRSDVVALRDTPKASAKEQQKRHTEQRS